MRRNYVFTPGICILIFCSLSSAASQDQLLGSQRNATLILDIKPSKSVYQKGETVEIEVTLRNASKDDQIVPRQLHLTLNVDLEILNPQGTRADWCGRIADQIIPSKSRYKTLSPDESVHTKLAVSCVNKDDRRRAWGYALDKPGKYIIKAAYRLPQPKEYFENLFPGAHVARGPVSAKPVTIELK